IERKLAIAFSSVYRSISFTKEETSAYRIHHVGPQNQRDMRRLRKKSLVDFEIRVRKKNLAPRMRVVPAHELIATAWQGSQLLRQLTLVIRRERKRGSECVLAFQRHGIENLDSAILTLSQQDTANFSTAPGKRKEGIHHGKPDVIDYLGIVFNGEWCLLDFPCSHAALLIVAGSRASYCTGTNANVT